MAAAEPDICDEGRSVVADISYVYDGAVVLISSPGIAAGGITDWT